MHQIFDRFRQEAEIEAAATVVYSALIAGDIDDLVVLLDVQVKIARDSAKDAAGSGDFLASFLLDFYAGCLENYCTALKAEM